MCLIIIGTQGLLAVGGFPEPFLDGEPQAARRWRRERIDRIIRDDVRDLAPLHDLTTPQLFARSLMRRVGGLVVLANLAADCHIAHKTAQHWLEVLAPTYILFIVRSFATGLARALSNLRDFLKKRSDRLKKLANRRSDDQGPAS